MANQPPLVVLVCVDPSSCGQGLVCGPYILGPRSVFALKLKSKNTIQDLGSPQTEKYQRLRLKHSNLLVQNYNSVISKTFRFAPYVPMFRITS